MEGSTAGRLPRFYETKKRRRSDKHIIQNITQRKAEQTEHEPILAQQTTFQKPVGPNGTVITMIS